ncbi:hypothetical protein GH733_013069 [Mirounga leonina]|nr:hypothetical protein GH733_013069 [Mirounga leonina]
MSVENKKAQLVSYLDSTLLRHSPKARDDALHTAGALASTCRTRMWVFHFILPPMRLERAREGSGKLRKPTVSPPHYGLLIASLVLLTSELVSM